MGLILVDTSVWVDHIRQNVPELSELIENRRCVLHPYALAEIALGNLANWSRRVAQLQALPSVDPVPEQDLLEAIAHLKLQGSGLGFVDVHQLASCRAVPDMRLWSRDKRLSRQAEILRLAWQPA